MLRFLVGRRHELAPHTQLRDEKRGPDQSDTFDEVRQLDSAPDFCFGKDHLVAVYQKCCWNKENTSSQAPSLGRQANAIRSAPMSSTAPEKHVQNAGNEITLGIRET